MSVRSGKNAIRATTKATLRRIHRNNAETRSQRAHENAHLKREFKAAGSPF